MNIYQHDDSRFRDAFKQPQEWFTQFGDSWECGPQHDLLVHQDNGKDVLVVAHTDYVVPYMYRKARRLLGFKVKQHTKAKKLVKTMAKDLTGPVVDYRLGCALALGMSSWADLLFTDAEEVGMSTAAYFDPPRRYNWIVNLDRRGTDVVTYQYQSKEWLAALEEFFTIGMGSLSDISSMGRLGVSAFNMGIGYQKEHSFDATWNPNDTKIQLQRLGQFVAKWGDTHFEHDEKAAKWAAKKSPDWNWQMQDLWFS